MPMKLSRQASILPSVPEHPLPEDISASFRVSGHPLRRATSVSGGAPRIGIHTPRRSASFDSPNANAEVSPGSGNRGLSIDDVFTPGWSLRSLLDLHAAKCDTPSSANSMGSQGADALAGVSHGWREARTASAASMETLDTIVEIPLPRPPAKRNMSDALRCFLPCWGKKKAD